MELFNSVTIKEKHGNYSVKIHTEMYHTGYMKVHWKLMENTV